MAKSSISSLKLFGGGKRIDPTAFEQQCIIKRTDSPNLQRSFMVSAISRCIIGSDDDVISSAIKSLGFTAIALAIEAL